MNSLYRFTHALSSEPVLHVTDSILPLTATCQLSLSLSLFPLAGGRSLLAIRSMRHMAPLLPRMVAALQQQQQRLAPSSGGGGGGGHNPPPPPQHRFQCSYCSYSTNYQTNLNNHVRVHTGERPFVCRHCNRTFSRNEHLKKHRCRATEAAQSFAT